MTLEPLGYPWRGQGKMRHKKQQELLRRVRTPLQVDKSTMWKRETSGGTIIGVKPTAGGTGIARWFRIINDVELSACEPSETNEMRCRDTLGCGGDDVPSLYGIWTDFDPAQCEQADQETTCTLIYFPGRFTQCQALVTPTEPPCLPNKWIGMLVQAFFNERTQRWESDSTKIEEWDQVDFVRFCNMETLLVCGTGSCPDPEAPPGTENLNCCIFDGMVRRDTGPKGDTAEDCSYHCGAKNKAFDVWILCNDVTSLPAGQDCFPARRIDDAFTLQYCPLGNDGPMISETRPVYSIGCCGCGCPDDELYLEFFLTRVDPVNGRVAITGCEDDGERISLALTRLADDPPGTRNYEGYFCRNYEIPVFLVMTEDPADPYPVFIRPDCLTGLAASQWVDEADEGGTGGGCCYVSVTGKSALAEHTNGLIDVLKRFISDGDPDVCEPEYQTCRFCYKVTMSCSGGVVSDIEIHHCLPPGHPAYAGTPQESPGGPLEDLITVGDSNALVTENLDCDGRQWYTMDLDFGRGDPLDLMPVGSGDTYYGWPHIEQHVFGGCCWDHIVLGSTASTVCSADYDNNICACLGLSEAGLDTCRQTIDYQSPRALVKISWNCANDPL